MMKKKTSRNLPWKVVYHSWQHATIYDNQDKAVCRFDLEDLDEITEDNQEAYEAIQKDHIEWILDSVNHNAEQQAEIARLTDLRITYGPICLICGAAEPCELKDDLHSPCTFDPAPKELYQRCEWQGKEIARLTKERDTWHIIVKDDCDEDDRFRNVAGKWDLSDSYGVEEHTEILERVMRELDRVMGEAVNWCELAKGLAGSESYGDIVDSTHDFLHSPEVQAWRKRQEDQSST